MKHIDLGLDETHTKLTVAEAKKLPCFGLCGKTWADSAGGWMEFEESGAGAVVLAPRWFCNECSRKRSAGESVMKSDSLDS